MGQSRGGLIVREFSTIGKGGVFVVECFRHGKRNKENLESKEEKAGAYARFFEADENSGWSKNIEKTKSKRKNKANGKKEDEVLGNDRVR